MAKELLGGKHMLKRLSPLTFLALMGIALLLAACSGRPGSEEEAGSVAQAASAEEAEEEAGVPVEIELVEIGDISLVFSYSGTVQPEDEINVVPGAAGRVESLLVEVGDEVQAGDPIAIIEDDNYLAQLKQAEAALTTARLNLAKMELGSRPEEIAASQAAVELARASLNDVANIDDNERTRAAAELARAEAALRTAQTEYDKIAWAGDVGSTPQSAALQQATITYETSLANYNLNTNPSDSQLSPLMLQLAQAELNLALRIDPFREVDFATARAGIAQAEAAVELANLQLEETTITAPFAGTIAELNITEGSRVNQQAPIASLISDQLETVINVEESRISQVSPGQSAALNVSAYPGQDFPAMVTSVAPTADRNTRTFEVKLTPTDGAELLRSGMFADVSVLAQENTNSLLAPRTAVFQNGDEPTVFVIDGDHTARQRPVTTGLFDDSRVEILSGLKAGDAVVVAGQPNLIDGAKVEIISDPRIAE
jgi:HlyD family secretion protein